MADSPLFKRLRQRAREVSEKAARELLDAEQRGDMLGAAVRTMQQGRRVWDEQGQRVVGTLGLATQEDLERVSRKIGRLRKRLTDILDRLE